MQGPCGNRSLGSYQKVKEGQESESSGDKQGSGKVEIEDKWQRETEPLAYARAGDSALVSPLCPQSR